LSIGWAACGGGPLIGLFESASHLAHHVISGIIIQCTTSELEKVIARRADLFCEDGSIIEPQRGI